MSPAQAGRDLAGCLGFGRRIRCVLDRADGALQCFPRQRPRPQQRRRLAGQVQHGRFHADRRGAGVQHEIDAVAEIFHHVGGAGGAGSTEPVGARGSDRDVCRGEQRLDHRMVRHPQGDGRSPGRDRIRDDRGAFDDEGQRPGPESRGQVIKQRRNPARQATGHPPAGDMHNQRIPVRPLLGLENPAHGNRIERVGAETVNGFGRERDQPAVTDDVGGLADERGIGVGGIDSYRVVHRPRQDVTGKVLFQIGFGRRYR